MTDNIKTTKQEAHEKDLIFKIVGFNEDEPGTNTYKMSHAKKGESGFSVGRLQTDLGQDGKYDERKKFIDTIKKVNKTLPEESQFSAEEIAAVEKGIKIKSKSDAIPLNIRKKIDTALNTEQGKQLVDGFDKKQADTLYKDVKATREHALKQPHIKANKESVEFVKSPEFAVRVADNINQYGTNDRMKNWIRGDKTYETNDGQTKSFPRALDKNTPLNADALYKYTGHYKDKPGRKRRHKNIIDAIAEDKKNRKLLTNEQAYQDALEENIDQIEDKETQAPDTAPQPEEQEETTEENTQAKPDTTADSIVEESPKDPQTEKDKQAFLDGFFKNIGMADTILAKAVTEFTDDELQKAQRFAGANPYHPQRADVQEHIAKIYKARYPGNVEYDAAGRQVDSKPAFSIPKKPVPIKDIFGNSLERGLSVLAAKMATGNNNDAVKLLQKGLNKIDNKMNIVDDDKDVAKYLAQKRKLKEDNDLGPKTAARTFEVMKDQGVDDVLDKLDILFKEPPVVMDEIPRGLDGKPIYS